MPLHSLARNVPVIAQLIIIKNRNTGANYASKEESQFFFFSHATRTFFRPVASQIFL
jgi:hypothetical protein